MPAFDTEFDTRFLQQSTKLRLILYFQVSSIFRNENVMAKKLFLNMESAIPSTQIPSISREETASTSGNNPLSEQERFFGIHCLIFSEI